MKHMLYRNFTYVWCLICELLKRVWLVSFFSSITLFSSNAFSQGSGQIELLESSSKSINSQLTKWEGRASQGDREAQFRLGLYYGSNISASPDSEQAAYWYGLAAVQGHTLAQYNLGTQYMTGDGVNQSSEKALKLWLQAANAGHIHAQFNVGRAYLLGVGLEENHLKARYWFEKAADQNEPKSIELLGRIRSQENDTASSKINNNLQTNSGVKSKAVESVKNTPRLNSIVTKEKDNQKDNIGKENKLTNVYVIPGSKGGLLDQRYKVSSLVFQSKVKSGWLKVKSKEGFLTWVHSDFVSLKRKVSDAVFLAVVTGDRVLTRSEPSVSKGSTTIVGVFRKNESIEVVGKKGDWYRVKSPLRITAWVET